MGKLYKETIKINVPFNLDYTLNCGQTFRWDKIGSSWMGVAGRQPFILKYDKETGYLEVKSISSSFSGFELKNVIEDYLGLNDSLGVIKESAYRSLAESGNKDYLPKMKKIFEKGEGLRILRQDPWEMAVEYLMSSQSSISTIKSRIEQICRKFGNNRVTLDGIDFYLFPDSAELRSLSTEDFLSVGLGFRAKWIKKFIEKNDEKALFEIKGSSFDRKMDFFLQNEGIGYKIASCILLFGYAELSSFPVDVWITRVMEKEFSKNGSSEKLMREGQKMFGPYAGYVQEYFFLYYRNFQ